MKLDRIQFSLGVSLLLHGLAVGGAVYFVRIKNVEAVKPTSIIPTIELIATEPPPKPVEKIVVQELPKPSPENPPEQGTILEPQSESKPVLQETIQPAIPAEQKLNAVVTAPETVKQISPVATADLHPNAADSSDNFPVQAFAVDETDTKPEYPLAARRRHQQGLVILSVIVGADGRASKVGIKESSGYPLLDASAEKHARDRKYSPAKIGKNAVESEIEVPIRFKLTD